MVQKIFWRLLFLVSLTGYFVLASELDVETEDEEGSLRKNKRKMNEFCVVFYNY